MRKSLILTALLFYGCGGTGVTGTDKPHSGVRTQTSETSVTTISNTFTTASRDENGSLTLTFSADSDLSGIDDIRHFQIYLDTDMNASTGFNDGPIDYNGIHYEIVGADYMIEDNKLYRSTSHTAWAWDFMTDIDENIEDVTKDGRISLYKRSYHFSSSLLHGLQSQIRVSVEPLNVNYKDTNNFVPTEMIHIGEN
jgi:hypothetical protein